MAGLEAACRAIEAEPWRVDLINDYHACAIRWADQINHLYPGEDFEPLVMSGLYLAAATWEPAGRGSFLRWLRVKVRGSTKSALHSRRKRRAGYLRAGPLPAGMAERPRMPPIRFHPLSQAIIDRRFIYRPEYPH